MVRAAAADGVGPRAVDGAAAFAGLPDAGRRRRGRAGGARCRSRRSRSGPTCSSRRGAPSATTGPTCSSTGRTATPCSTRSAWPRAAARVSADAHGAARRGAAAAAPTAPGVARLGDGDTTHLCALDADGLGVSLTQSNALDFGSHLVEPTTGVFLHNRGVGLLARSRATRPRSAPGGGRRTPCPRCSSPLRTAPLTHLVGAMGGDAQPQIIGQLLARLLRSGQDPATAITRAAAHARRAVGRALPAVVGRRPHRAGRGGRAAGVARRARRRAATGCGPSAPSTPSPSAAPRSSPSSDDAGGRPAAWWRRRTRAAPTVRRWDGDRGAQGGRRAGAPLRIASLAKQVPLRRVDAASRTAGSSAPASELEMNAYCRRAVAEGVTLARETGGSCTVVTLGPPSAEDVLREAVAWGADSGLHRLRPRLRRLRHPGHGAGAGRRRCGRPAPSTSSCSAATPRRRDRPGRSRAGRAARPPLRQRRAPAARTSATVCRLELEHDDGTQDVEITLPAVLSVAERLCDPCKVDPEGRAAVPAVADLPARTPPSSARARGGTTGSPTVVGAIHPMEHDRACVVLDGPLAEQVEEAVPTRSRHAARSPRGRRARAPSGGRRPVDGRTA